MSKKKPTRKTGAAHGNGAAALTEADDIPAGGVRIRMYCQGLGDCFLLTFPPARGRPPFHMLIDCGLILGTPQADERMEQVAESIADETAGTLDLLVGTHEHWDHVSGFVQAQETFGELEIKNTWLAWTEDPKDPLAKKLRKQREDKKQKLALALDHFGRLAGAGPESPQQQRLAGVASFFGLDLSAAAEKGLGKTAQAMAFLGQQKPKFLRPGDKPEPPEGPPGVEFFVLGPPADEKALKKSLPTKKGHEAYEEDMHALVGLDVPAANGRAENQPFEDRCSMPLAAALSDPYFVQMYDNGLPDHPAAWRRIDDVGMFAATDLALQLDAETNNTSLVLAIRLAGGQVLLFPGDAQVGNWESWHKVEFDGGPTTPELLADTVIYKVGHHGSHNATLRALGLELMSSPDLTALLPVDERIAHDNKGWTKMPFVPLLTELRKRTKGRILRPDHEVPHALTDLAAGDQPTWVASAETFADDPKRSVFLETVIRPE